MINFTNMGNYLGLSTIMPFMYTTIDSFNNFIIYIIYPILFMGLSAVFYVQHLKICPLKIKKIKHLIIID